MRQGTGMRAQSPFGAPVGLGRARGLLTRCLAGLATIALVTGGIVVAVPEAAGAFGTLSQSCSANPASVPAGTTAVISCTVTNSGTTDVTLNTYGTVSRGWITAMNLPCSWTNLGATSATGSSILICPSSGSAVFSPGLSITGIVYIDTTGLEGKSITYNGHTNSPDLAGGRTDDISATVNVLDPTPTVSISSPVDGSRLDNVNDTTLSANATPGNGASISSVDFFRDGSTYLGSDYDPPFQVTIPVNTLSQGTHTLTANVLDSAENSASDTISVTQGVPPTVAITSPSDTSTLDTGTATTFSAAATPSTDATVTSVDFSVDGTQVASLDTPLPATTTYQTSIPTNSLSVGSHTLSVQVNDSRGESATDVVTVTQPAFVGPTVTIKPTVPAGFTASYFDRTQTFSTITTLQSGDVIQSVVWDVDGTPRVGSPTKPYAITIDPDTLGAGTHSLNVTVTSLRGVGSDTLVVTVPRATLSMDDATPGDNIIAPLSTRFVPGPDPGDDAAWLVPVTNSGDGTAHNVTLELVGFANASSLSFDLAVMPGCVVDQVFDNSQLGLRCDLGSIGSGLTRNVSVRIPTAGVTDGTQILGIARLDSSNADLPPDSTLAVTTAVIPQPVVDPLTNQVIAAAEVIQIASSTSAQAATVVNTTDPVSASNQVLIRVRQPRKIFASSLTPLVGTPARFASFATSATLKVGTTDVAFNLKSVDVTDPLLCPVVCKGRPAIIDGDFSRLKDKANPIKATIVTFLPGAVLANPTKGIAATVGEFYFRGEDGEFPLTGPAGLAMCKKDLVTKRYATPCHVGKPAFKLVKDALNNPIGVNATDTFLFVGGDPGTTRR